MSELSSVLNFLENSKKGRLSYDRDWAKSPESVQKLLNGLTMGVQQLEIDPTAKTRQNYFGQEMKAATLFSDDKIKSEYSVNDDLEDEVLASDKTVINVKNCSEKEMIAHTPIDELLMENNEIMHRESKFSSILNKSEVKKQSESILTDRDVEYNNRKNIILTNDCDEDLEDSIISLSEISSRNRTSMLEGSGKYFGLNPVRVSVNRSFEINIDDPQHIRQPRSRFGIVDENRISSPSRIQHNYSELDSSQIKCSTDNSIFVYNPGFIEKVKEPELSVDVVNHRLQSIRHLLDLGDNEGHDESNTDESDDREFIKSDSEEEYEIHDLKLIALKQTMRLEAERENAELLKKFEDTSLRLAQQAEARYKEEMELHHRQSKLEQDKLEREKQDDLRKAQIEEANELAAESARREETKKLIQLCKEQEEKLKQEQEKENKIKEQSARFGRILPELKTKMVSLLDLWSSVEDKALFCQASTETADNIHTDFSSTIDGTKTKIQTGSAVTEDWEKLVKLEVRIEKGIRILQEDIDRIKQEAAQAAQEAARKAQEESEKKAEEAAKQKEVSPAVQPQVTVPDLAPNIAVQPNTEHLPTPQQTAEQFYREIIQFKTKYVETVEFTDQEKKMKSELTLGISTALNSISAQTKEHLNDKLGKLALLLAGKPVTMKDTQICAGQHRFGVKYCTALLAKKIVRQGEDVVSSKAEAAFPIASVAVALWDIFPDFGKLLQAYFFEFCPLLAPYYPPKLEGQSEKDYFTSLGYRWEKDGIEKQDMYLKRMSGLARLFSAITAVSKPLGSQSLVHPMGPNFTWRFLVNLINCAPLPDVTATILFVVLETTGYLMLQKYRDQFLKLVSVIKCNYVPALDAVKTDGGPTSRLDMLLTKTLTEKTVDKPRGGLMPGFINKVNV